MSTSGGRDNHHNRWSASLTALFAAALLLPAFLLAADRAAAIPPEQLPAATIVFENGGRIVSIKADGTGRKVLTRKNAWVGQPWGLSDNGPLVSPDGGSIIFNRYYDGFRDGVETGLMIMDRDGSNLRKLVEDPERGGVYGGAWTPDGSRIILIEYTEDSTEHTWTGTSTIFSVKADGTDRRHILTSRFRYSEKGDQGKVTGQKWLPFDVEMAPDGTRLLVTAVNFFVDEPARLEWVDPESGQRSIFENSASSPSFSPDGTRVTFDSDRDQINVSCYEGNCSGDSQVFIKELASGEVHHLLPGKPVGSNWGSDWSADGDRITFTSTRSPGQSDVGAEIWTVAPDGSCLTRLTNGSPDSSAAEWMPGGLTSGCQEPSSAPLSEVTPDEAILELKLPVLWVGNSAAGQLLSDTFKDGKSLSAYYADCGRASGDCGPVLAIDSGPVCSRSLEGDLMTGRYLGMERIRGGLLVRNINRGRQTDSSFYSGGLETGIHSLSQKGKSSGFGFHRRIVSQLRPVGQAGPVTENLGETVLPWSVVKTARVMLRAFRATHSLTTAAKRAGVFVEKGFIGVRPTRNGAVAWLRFARDLKQVGKVRSIKCKRWNNLPDTIAVRSRLRELIR